MSLISIRELRKIIHPHYILNLLLASSYVVLKTVRPLCSFAFGNCTLDHRELEIMVYTAIVVIFRTRKQGAVNLLPYFETACMLAKMGNVVLYFYSDPVFGVVFIVCCLFHLLLIPEPSYKGPENISYLRSADFEQEIEKDKKVVWIIEMYAPWNPSCIDFASTFSELSATYALPNLKFGKVDLSRSPEIGTKFKINTSPLTKQLPTLISFVDGKEKERRPLVAPNGKVIPFSFTFENIVSTFDLNNIHKDCKQRSQSKENSKGHQKSE
ncbi:thioredoxin-related transmembrane protein 2-like protein [Dinothrombium tinctorium]|uniref:Thioredoxin-related transmembrane protein 2-like protein n=1 Tax=Dinothrombium tinctorium TaxID=1965070 RepID=A0A3S3Q314_9ACAR|nr:thioredoxin-related transmembrane protein 2-like protein [Dinothrombium tinctorium]